MIGLLDTDILIDVALGREPFSEHSAMVLNAAEIGSFRAFIAWHSISNFSYIVEPARARLSVKGFIVELLQFVEISPTTTKDVFYATELKLADFEDAMQVAAARACAADLIVTRNVKHYKRSPIPAQTPVEFVQRFS